MPETRTKSIEVRIHEQYETLPDSERKLADVILDAPGELSAYTATELTSLAGVSKAAGTRLFRRLGFANFDEAKLLARETTHWGSPLYMDRKASGHLLSMSDYIEEEVFALKKSFMRLNPADIETVATRIVAAKRVFLMGFRNSHFLANYLRWQMLQFRGDVHLIPSGGETAGEYIGDLTEDDLLIVFALRRRTTRLESFMKAAKDRKTPILLIIDPTARGHPGLADWTFFAEVETSSTLDSSGAALSLARFIAIAAMQRSGKRGRAHLERIERQHEILGEFE
ncbi:MurR/RpiR family transcriptional regulator [uncultured Cohaesibacter sp.]|uniref:MurR/RpiR family transcriptional regulator n=1 Tax=uncultured Cohaesibacter sp. TaxID=1002546 RepID=UPI0029C636FC|nr:MurR/RpiR family transcriptional regulator [uncultured Cohaesibacter sp.]